MEEKDLKKVGIDLFSSQPKVESVFCVVDNGKKDIAMVAGTGVDIIKLLASVMINEPQVREFFEKAYRAAIAHIAKQ